MLKSKTVTVIGNHQVTVAFHLNAPHLINYYYESQAEKHQGAVRLYNVDPSPFEMRRCESVEWAQRLCDDWNKYQMTERYADGDWKRVYYILF